MESSQVSRQLVFLLGASGALGAAASARESPSTVETMIASGLTLPVAVVSILPVDADRASPRRPGVGGFRISICAHAETASLPSTYPGSGGSSVTELALRSAVKTFLASVNNGEFIQSSHGFQGLVTSTSKSMLALVDGSEYAVCDLEVEVYDMTVADSFPAPTSFVASAGTAHSIDLVWTNPPTRFDTGTNVLRRGANPGDAAPTTPGGGNGIPLSGALAAFVNDGGHSALQHFYYSLFHVYADGSYASVNADATTT